MNSTAGPLFNSYSRLPVYDQVMFFGRRDERVRVIECLSTRTPSIWLIGQKRVGKTSLLLYLKDYELPERGFAPVFVDFQLMGAPEQTNYFYEVAAQIYTTMSADARLDAVGSPLRSLFDSDPTRQLIDYLLSVQQLLGGRRLVLLMDEFSRLTDAYLAGRLEGTFFDRWRATMHATQRAGIAYVVVVQQQTCDTLSQRLGEHPDDPSRRLMDVGERLQLRRLQGADARRLIEWPMRDHLEYTPDVVDQLAALTGGSPFLTQALCYSLVMYMARRQRRQVTLIDLEQVRQEFMQPQDHTFAHMTEMLKGIANKVAGAMARLAVSRPDSCVTSAELQQALPGLDADRLRATLHTMTELDLLVQPTEDCWRFTSLLFQQWLALNAA